jgi:glycosyltransferase involved in cell wall biosynthesis
VIDTFAFGIPLMYCADQPHPPEVEYLEDGVNAVHAPPGATPESFAERAVAVLQDRELLERLRAGCEASAEIYTIEQMVQNYAEGILAALESPKHP